MSKRKKILTDKLRRKLRSIKAKDIMTRDVVTTTEDTKLVELASVMIENHISGLPVVNKKKRMVGIITMTDLFVVMEMIRAGDVVEDGQAQIADPKVKFAMSTGVVKIKKNTTLEQIISMIRYKKIHTLPVFEGDKMVGVIGGHDVFKRFYETVKECM